MHPLAKKFLLGIPLFIGAIALVRDTIYQGNDFHVFFKTAQALLDGESVYSVSRDGAMSFKYPPWVVPFFIPFGLLPEYWARALFGWMNVGLMVWMVRYLLRHRISPGVLFAALFGFWGIWAVHALDGQINLLMLVLVLWAFERRSIWIRACFFWAASVKAFTIFWLGALLREWRSWVLPACAGAVGLGFLCVPVLMAGGSFATWMEAASSGELQFGLEKILGRDNQGLPALVMRWVGLKSHGGFVELGLFLVFSVLIGAWWLRASRRMNRWEQAMGWIGLGPVVHPLAWFHLFVWSFPLAVLALDRSWRSGDRRVFAIACLGFALIALVTSKTLGRVGLMAELGAVKSWGALLCAGVFASSKQK